MPQGASTRWCPTPEQVMILEEMYRNGIRTPNASQIQSITGHLSFFGKIEGKNVFYWFQNHKARERQKMRKKMNRIHHNHHNETIEFHHQQGINESTSMMNLSNRKENSFLLEDLQKPIFHGHDWMTVVDVTATTRGCRPIETLQLFPVENIKFEEGKPAPTN